MCRRIGNILAKVENRLWEGTEITKKTINTGNGLCVKVVVSGVY